MPYYRFDDFPAASRGPIVAEGIGMLKQVRHEPMGELMFLGQPQGPGWQALDRILPAQKS
jgi:hypothetical protein